MGNYRRTIYTKLNEPIFVLVLIPLRTILLFFHRLQPFSTAKLFRRVESEQKIRRNDSSVITEMV